MLLSSIVFVTLAVTAQASGQELDCKTVLAALQLEDESAALIEFVGREKRVPYIEAKHASRSEFQPPQEELMLGWKLRRLVLLPQWMKMIEQDHPEVFRLVERNRIVREEGDPAIAILLEEFKEKFGRDPKPSGPLRDILLPSGYVSGENNLCARIYRVKRKPGAQEIERKHRRAAFEARRTLLEWGLPERMNDYSPRVGLTDLRKAAEILEKHSLSLGRLPRKQDALADEELYWALTILDVSDERLILQHFSESALNIVAQPIIEAILREKPSEAEPDAGHH